MRNVLRTKLSEKDICPHCLIELSISEYNNYIDQAIILEGLETILDNDKKISVTKYATVTFGKISMKII